MSSRYQAGIVLPGYNALKVANAPTIGTATAGDTQVSVTFTAPACTGGGAISGYTVFANCGIKTASGASSPLVVTGLTNGTAYTFKAIATNVYGPSYPSAASNSATPAVVQGQDAYITAGTFSWVAPAGVTSVSVVAVGGGGGGDVLYGPGGGGGLGYKNNYSVTPGNSYTVVVGAGGSNGGCSTGAGTSGGNSYLVNTSTVKGGGGRGPSFGTPGQYCTQGTYTGDGGGNGGKLVTQARGGSGAGGYSGTGGNSPTSCGGFTATSGSSASACSGGGGSGGVYPTNSFQPGFSQGAGGGGVGLLGIGATGAGGGSVGGPTSGGRGGSGGANGVTVGTYGGCGGAYGGGGGAGWKAFIACCYYYTHGGCGGVGAVRIIWPGNTRSFPSTCTGNL